jgi:hypothetical protein
MKYYAQKMLVTREDWESVPWVRRVEVDHDCPPRIIVSIPWWCWKQQKVMEYIQTWVIVGIQVVYRPCWW